MYFKKINHSVHNLIPKWLGLLFLLVGLLYFASFFYHTEPAEKVSPERNTETAIVSVGDTILNVAISDTDKERSRGLSGHKTLLLNEGMLFVFERPSRYGFWMKDMNFPIDIAWIDENKKIIYIEENVLPESFPKIFQPPASALYVLEVSSDFIFTNKIKIGDSVIF